MTENNRPIHSVKYGNVEASVWARNTTSGYFFDTTFGRVFKSGDEWGKSGSFSDYDLLNLAAAATDIFRWIHDYKKGSTGIQENEDS
jgi:hypothetical protein